MIHEDIETYVPLKDKKNILEEENNPKKKRKSDFSISFNRDAINWDKLLSKDSNQWIFLCIRFCWNWNIYGGITWGSLIINSFQILFSIVFLALDIIVILAVGVFYLLKGFGFILSRLFGDAVAAFVNKVFAPTTFLLIILGLGIWIYYNWNFVVNLIKNLEHG